MGGSTADTPATPEFLRASDAERDHAVGELQERVRRGPPVARDLHVPHAECSRRAEPRPAGGIVHRPAAAPRPGCWPGSGPSCGARTGRAPRPAGGAGSGNPGHRPDHGLPERAGAAGAVRGVRRHRWRPELAAPLRPAVPVPLVFPPGSGVRFTIGRTRDCDLCLTDLSVSRMHALLMRREDGWVLSDLGSHNGTRLNGWLVREPVPVHAGRPGGVRLDGVRHPGRSPGGAPAPGRAFRVKGAEPARVGKRDNGSAGPARAHRDDRSVLTGWTPGIPLDDRGRAQAARAGGQAGPAAA